MKRPSSGLLVVLAAAAAVHLTVAVLDFPTLARNGFLYDDSFYAFQIARNVALGHGPTFDGVHFTNGFQPLYVLVLVPVFKVLGGSDTLPIHAALMLSALLTVGAAYFLYRLLVRHVGDTAACISAAAWAFSPIVTRQSANGLETALALCMVAATVTFYLERIRSQAGVPRRRFATLGALLGLCILARADLGFLALATGLDYLLVARSRGPHYRWAGDFATTVGVCVLVCLPWVLYGALAVGSPIPESGRATRFLALAYAPFFGLAPASLSQHGPTLSFVSELLVRSADTLRVIPILHPFFRGLQKIGEHAAPGTMDAIANVAAILMTAGFTLWWFRRRRRSGDTAREFDFLVVFALSLIAAYSTLVYGVFFFLRYYYPIYFVGMIFAGLAVEDAIAWFRRRPVRLRRAVLASSGVYAAALVFMGYTAAFRTQPVYHFYDAARWIRSHTDASDTIGTFQSGAIGYLSHRRVLDLDGKVNSEAYSALLHHRLNQYVSAAGIDVVIDSMPVLDLFLGPWSAADRHRIESERVFTGREHGLPGWIGYRVSPPRVFNADASSPSTPGSSPSPAP